MTSNKLIFSCHLLVGIWFAFMFVADTYKLGVPQFPNVLGVPQFPKQSLENIESGYQYKTHWYPQTVSNLYGLFY